MGGIISLSLDGVARLASPDLCDAETWNNTLRNRSSYTVLDHLEVLSTDHREESAYITDAVCEEFPLSVVEPLSPASSSSSISSDLSSPSRRRRLDFAGADKIAFYAIGSPSEEMFGHGQVVTAL